MISNKQTIFGDIVNKVKSSSPLFFRRSQLNYERIYVMFGVGQPRLLIIRNESRREQQQQLEEKNNPSTVAIFGALNPKSKPTKP